MAVYTRQVLVNAPPDQVFRYCTSQTGFCQQFPFPVRWLTGADHWQLGDILDFRYRVCGLWLRTVQRWKSMSGEHCSPILCVKAPTGHSVTHTALSLQQAAPA